MKVLVTGHMGFIGTHLCAALKAEGHNVIGADIKDGKDITKVLLPDGIGLCFHLAAQTDAQFPDPVEDAETNILGTLRILEKYRDRVIFASSSAVNYPHTPYAISKLACEHYCKLYGARIVRLCNIFGEGGHGVFEMFEEEDPITINGEGDQIRTYATVADAVVHLTAAPKYPAGCVSILYGKNLTVLDIADRYFPNKDRIFRPMPETDIVDGRQL